MSLNIWEFTVTRQHQWPDGDYVVEVSQGGSDYSNPDALVGKYRGEFETFKGMTEAVEAAIQIGLQWQADSPDKRILIAASGCTHGNTMPFEGRPVKFKTVQKALLKEAKEFDEKLPRCAQCGDILGKERYGDGHAGEYDCCSEYCAEKYYAPGCAECGGTIEGNAYGKEENCCSEECAEQHDEPDPNDCAECARSYGPNYTGPCEH